MQKKTSVRNDELNIHAIKALRISLASPEHIRALSSGQVTKPETLHHRTLKPEIDGLFCERIFGPTKNWTCTCGKYKRPKFKGKVCEKCGVSIAPARVRRARMGHIELVAPVCHSWYAHGASSKISVLLGIPQRELVCILSYTHFVVLHIDEPVRRKEIQRIRQEIARFEALQANGEKTNKEGSSDTSAPQVHLSTILDDLKILARFTHGEVSEEALGRRESLDAEEDSKEATLEHATLYELRRVEKLLTELTPLALVEIEEYRLLKKVHTQGLCAGIGAEAIETLLKMLDLDQMADALRQGMKFSNDAVQMKAMKRLKVVETLRRSGSKPEWMILHIIPVLPPDLRPVLILSGGRFAASDVNELYGRIIQRNNRLKRLLASGAPDIMIFREKHALQQSCDALIDNGHLAHPVPGPHGKALRSLSDTLSGKDGRFRRNLLGKRVDFSGRSVISVGLDLKLHQCGLPKKIALELFKPFIVHKLIISQYYPTPRQAKRAVERRDPAVWDILDEVMRNRVVLLNRAPTLHRLSIQAFEPVLVEGSAIRLHPQVCSAFNADFDGDQMAVHLPLSMAAQKEAHDLMLSTRNMLSPASGEPAVSVTQEQVLGCYYLTQERPQKKGEGRVFADIDDALQAYAYDIIDLQARISVRLNREIVYNQSPPAPSLSMSQRGRIQTTVGRLIFNKIIPRQLGFRNYAMKKDYLKQLVMDSIKACSMERAAVMVNEIKRLGFQYATKSGISFSILTDVETPEQKRAILAQADRKIEELREAWQGGLITRSELYEQSIEIWKAATDEVAAHVQQVLDPYGSLTTIANSGATKAKLQQIRQLSGMRGLMASPSGAIIEAPVRGNFLEGLGVAEYFISSHGARKSLMDRSLNTAHSGYLTIQLVNAAQDVIVTQEDCGTQDGLLISTEDSLAMGLSDNSSRLIGRALAKALPTVRLAAGVELDEAACSSIETQRVDSIFVRSVLTCQTRYGVCQKCYGWDLSRRSLVAIGTAVGIIAAQSIGEPGTQLTMRTFHSGGIAGGQGDITQGIPRVQEIFGARAPKARESEVSNPHEILSKQGREALALYLLKEAQLVYRTTGAYIHDKHFEVIIRQMVRYVQVKTAGDTKLLPGDVVDRFLYADSNRDVVAQGGEAATAHAVLLSLIQTALASESWLSAASFQQTIRVLTDAVLEGRIDHLRGLKENVMLGRLIPAGTGLSPQSQLRQSAQTMPARRGRPPKK